MMSQQEMSNGDDESDEVALRFRELCLAVNMDKPTMELAWMAYENTRMHYSLEGDTLHWLVCSLYAACRRNLPSIQSVSGQAMQSNCVSLTKLLREAKFSFISFLKKVDKWLQMNPKNEALSDHISSLGRSFEVSTNVFKNYMEIFRYVFLDPDDPKYLQNIKANIHNPSRPHRSRRHRKTNCTPRDIFNFCWTFFIHAKGTQYCAISDELVSSFQLLLSVINLCYLNALTCDHRTLLLNPTFPGLPANWNKADFNAGEIGEHEIIGLLVKHKAGLSKEQTEEFLLQTRVVNIHNWTKFVQSLLDPSANVLVGTERSLLMPQHFDNNFKSINRLYEEYVLTEGDFDERVFLCDDVDRELGTPIKSPPPNTGAGHREMVDHLSSSQPSMLRTPLTNREYLNKSDGGDNYLTPVSSAVQSSIKLRKILNTKKDKPSDKLSSVFSECTENPEGEIEERLLSLCKIFMREYVKPYGEIPASQKSFAESYSQTTRTLYYHLLEGIMIRERSRLNGKGDLTPLLKRDDFHSLLFACCVEIVLDCNQSRRVFPWIVDTMDIFPYYFYKVIELVIRAEENLPNQCIKHLNHIEEQILESLAWKHDSPLWVALDDLGGVCPQCEEVNHSQHLESSASSSASGVHAIGSSPLAHPRIKAVVNDDMGSLRKSESSSAHDRFSSPSPGSAKRRLFPISNEPKSPNAGSFQHVAPSSPGGSKSITTSPTRGKSITLVSIKKSQTPENRRPQKAGSLALFFRKVYHLSGVRLRHLFGNLVIANDLRSKIWTCFEYSISKKALELMRDRHIDQLLMCSIYVMAKITQHDYSFQEIMRCYRNQPQANSNVYRSVLIHRGSPVLMPSSGTPPTLGIRSESTLPGSNSSESPSSTPTHSGQQHEERDDLIQFYNKVYVPAMRDFVKQFSSSGESAQLEVPISPMPLTRKMIQSPRKVAGNVYISPLRPRLSMTHGCMMEYNFQRSPNKQLREINSMMHKHKSPAINGKRHLAFGEDGEPDAKRPVSKRLQMVQAQRNGFQ